MKRQDIREHLFRLLFRVEFTDSREYEEQTDLYFNSPSEEEDELDSGFSQKDDSYIREKYTAILNKIADLDSIVGDASKGWDLGRLGKVELTILRLAAYEIIYDDDIPVGVAIDQAVELAKKYGQHESSSFVNGILGNIARISDEKDCQPQ
ncbi:MAG: transcription antitermination factor NusB [Lachnospiraceae bacterium]|nr:transcription antitermination factor NusB [Lachnospiraceae bacterium]